MPRNSGDNKHPPLKVWRLALPAWAASLHRLLEPPRAVGPETPPRFWGTNLLPARLADPLNYLITGTIGSAKTIHMLLWLRLVLDTLVPGSNQRMVAYDPKNTLIKYLHAMGVNVPVKVILPSDVRSVRLALQKMITSMADAIQFAAAVVPPQPGENNPFFTNASRSLFSGVMQSLILSGGYWDLRDVILILEDEEYLTRVLGRFPQTASKLRLLAHEEVWRNIQATLEEKLGELKIVAAFWDRAHDELSLDDFLDSEEILVLGQDKRIDVVLSACYRLFFKRMGELILAREESKDRRIFLCLDEFPRVCGDEPIPGFEDLLSEGRDRGVVALIVFQHIQQLRLRYKDRADALVSYFRNCAYFAAGEESHAEWCSKHCGDERKREWDTTEGIGTNESVTWGGNNGSRTSGTSWNFSHTARIIDRRILPASEFLALPLPSKESGVKGYYRSPVIGLWESTIPGDWIDRTLPKKPSPDVPGYLPRPDSQQLLRPFGPNDLARLGLKDKPPDALPSTVPVEPDDIEFDSDA
jgi:Type IV secretion-system coupling protein DNA-binding domain